MSCDWDIYCQDHDENAGFEDANHAELQMWDLIRWVKHLSPQGLAKTDLYIRCELQGRPFNLPWLLDHAQCRLIPRNEYGDLSGECAARVWCSHCGEGKRCILPVGHDGMHKHGGPR